ncbi:MAG: site-specific integrase [Bacilli bacterium]|nr:site-specific integrase [Bacilli bacterium]
MSVRKLPDNRITKDGRAYAFTVVEYGLDGKKHQHQSKAYFTKEEALKAEEAYINKYKDIDVNPHITFYQAYLKVYEYKKDKVRPTTLKTYRDRIAFMKLFWDVELVDLNAEMYQRWRNQLNKTNLSDRYKTDIQKLIKVICNFAEKQWDFNLRKFYNKLEPFKTPGAVKKEMDIFTPDEFYKFISVIKDIQMRCLFKTLYYCGLRRGEARGLQWKNVDLENRKIYIKHQVQNNPITNNDKDWNICACKTNSSHRTVPIPEDLYNELSEFKGNLKDLKLIGILGLYLEERNLSELIR